MSRVLGPRPGLHRACGSPVEGPSLNCFAMPVDAPRPPNSSRSANDASGALPQAELVKLFQLFNAGRVADMAAAAAALSTKHPDDGQAWKAWGIALTVLGQEPMPALRRALALLPDDADLHGCLGGVLAGRGELDGAAQAYARALQLQPGAASAHCNLADVLTRLGRWQEAVRSSREALRLQPTLAAAHLNLGNALSAMGELEPAMDSFRSALHLNRHMAPAHLGLGMAHRQRGELALALTSLQQAVALRPQHAASQLQLGLALQAQLRPDAAAISFRAALRCQPDLAAAHFHLGNALADLGQLNEAVSAYRSALVSAPEWPQAQVNLGAALLSLDRAADAVDALHQAVLWQPESALAHTNLGNALVAVGRLSESLQHHQRATELAPDLALAQGNLGHALKAAGQPEAALVAIERALALQPDAAARYSELLFVRQHLPVAAQRRHSRPLPRPFAEVALAGATPFAHWPNTPEPDRCLRVGWLSGDLREHPVGYFTEAVFAALAALSGQPLRLHVYASHGQTDELSRRMQRSCDGWTDIGAMHDDAAAARIRADGIDVLVDLAGHTRHNRLPVLARKPAPVQASWLGYCASTGLPAVDAFIADRWIAPPGTEQQFVERLERLPDSFLCFSPPRMEVPVSALPALSGQGIRWGCFNQLAKMNDEVVAVWSRLLLALPSSRLVLQAQALGDAQVCAQVTARFAEREVRAGQLELHGPQDRQHYLAAYQAIDIALDPFPYPGGTTTLEALWMGVPVLTMPGTTALSRQGLSIAQTLGLGAWVAAEHDEYVARALRHASDLPALAALRQALRPRLLQSPLCDAPRFAGHMAACLRGLWHTWCKAQRQT